MFAMNICAFAGILSLSAGLKIISCTPLIIPQISAMPTPKIIVIANPVHTSVDPAAASDLPNVFAPFDDF